MIVLLIFIVSLSRSWCAYLNGDKEFTIRRFHLHTDKHAHTYIQTRAHTYVHTHKHTPKHTPMRARTYSFCLPFTHYTIVYLTFIFSQHTEKQTKDIFYRRFKFPILTKYFNLKNVVPVRQIFIVVIILKVYFVRYTKFQRLKIQETFLFWQKQSRIVFDISH